MTPARARGLLERQKVERREAKARQVAEAAVKAFRVRKEDRGRLVFVGMGGQRGAAEKGRKGWLVRVTKDGKKRLVTMRGKGFRPIKFADLQIPVTKATRKEAKRLLEQRKVRKRSGAPVLVGSGMVEPKWVNDFNDAVVERLAEGIRAVIQGQASRRRFVIEVAVLVEMPDGSLEMFYFSVGIEKADHVSIRLAGIVNFVRMKFYALMARELQFHGLVTSGSSNHIRRLKGNQGKDRKEWNDDHGERWRGNEDEVVRIRRIEWRMEQAK